MAMAGMVAPVALLAAEALHVARLGSQVDVVGFRRHARMLLASGVPPERVRWTVTGDDSSADLFGDETRSTQPSDGPEYDVPTLKVPPAFVQLTESVALHAEPQRFGLLYQLLWRLQHEPGLRHDPLDAQWIRARQMAHAVHRDRHKMKAFVRFRPVTRTESRTDQPALQVAWFEPEHHNVEAVAPFFAQRFANLHWAILTPLRSVFWDCNSLRFGEGARRDQAPTADIGEALWLTYYEHIFNPARLKLAMMKKEMPVRYWRNLPEAALIQPLTTNAHVRSTEMIERSPTVPLRTHRPAVPPNSLPLLAPIGPETDRTAVADADATAEVRRMVLTATREASHRCTGCPLYANATQTVFGRGPVDATLMFVGEQPGDQEDLRGEPFVGPAGQLFDRALAELAVARSNVYLTNAVKHFKFELRGKRRIHKTATQREAAACLDWLEREIELVKPKAIVALGGTAARSLLGRTVAVLSERGQWLPRADGTPVLVTLHPSALLRMPAEEREAAYRQWLADLALATKKAT